MGLVFTRERCRPIQEPTVRQIRHGLRLLRSYGRSSFAHLTRTDGTYLHVGGGGVTCVVERSDGSDAPQLRAYYMKPRVHFEDGTVLSFGAGKMELRRDEFLAIDTVAELFVAFAEGHPFPSDVGWRAYEVGGAHIERDE